MNQTSQETLRLGASHAHVACFESDGVLLVWPLMREAIKTFFLSARPLGWSDAFEHTEIGCLATLATSDQMLLLVQVWIACALGSRFLCSDWLAFGGTCSSRWTSWAAKMLIEWRAGRIADSGSKNSKFQIAQRFNLLWLMIMTSTWTYKFWLETSRSHRTQYGIYSFGVRICFTFDDDLNLSLVIFWGWAVYSTSFSPASYACDHFEESLFLYVGLEGNDFWIPLRTIYKL